MLSPTSFSKNKIINCYFQPSHLICSRKTFNVNAIILKFYKYVAKTSITENITGIVASAIIYETKQDLAPSILSFPTDSGNTTTFMPDGKQSKATADIKTSLGTPIKNNIAPPITGRSMSLINVSKYDFADLKSSTIGNFAKIVPVKSIALALIQFAAGFKNEYTKLGILNGKKPKIKPITIPIIGAEINDFNTFTLLAPAVESAKSSSFVGLVKI